MTRRGTPKADFTISYSMYKGLMRFSDKMNIETDKRHSIADVGYIAEFSDFLTISVLRAKIWCS